MYFGVQLNFVAYYHAAGFGYSVPGQTKFLPANLSGYGKTGFGLAIRVYHNAAKFNLYGNGSGNTFNGKIALNMLIVTTHVLVIFAFKPNFAVRGSIKEIRRF